MAVPPVQPPMGISDVILFLPRVVIGGVRGIGAGIAAGEGTVKTVAGVEQVFSQAVVRDYVAGKFMSPAIKEMIAKGAAAKGYAGIGTLGLRAGFDGFLKSLGSTGPKGLILFSGIGLIAILATSSGWSLFRNGQKNLKDLSTHGSTVDLSQSSSLHIGRLLAGAGLLGGGILTLIPGGAAVGIPLMGLSAATGAGLHVVRFLEGGAHMGRNSEIAPWPLNILLRPFSGTRSRMNA